MAIFSFPIPNFMRIDRLEEDPFLMPPICHFTCETTREKEWDNIAAIHSGLVMTTTWSFNKSKMGELKLVPEKFHNKNRTDFNSEATCICLTHCGNFVIIGKDFSLVIKIHIPNARLHLTRTGYSSGDVERFNMQSGIHRARYGRPAHEAAVRGIGCDSLNQIVVTGGSDGWIKFWNFKEPLKAPAVPVDKLKIDDGITMFRNHRESSVLSIALENFAVVLLDLDTRSVVRKFMGHTAQITDICFSPDSRWLITASMDCTIKVWDIPSSYLIDHFRVRQ